MNVFPPPPQAPQLNNLTTVMAATSLANSPHSTGAYIPHPRQELAAPAQPSSQVQPAQSAFPLPGPAVAVYPVTHAPVSMPQASRGTTQQEGLLSARLSAPHAQACGTSQPRPPHPAGMAPVSGYQGMPLTPAQLLNRYAGVNLLTEYEKGEVLDYKEIFTIGAGAEKYRPHPNRRAILHSTIL